MWGYMVSIGGTMPLHENAQRILLMSLKRLYLGCGVLVDVSISE